MTIYHVGIIPALNDSDPFTRMYVEPGSGDHVMSFPLKAMTQLGQAEEEWAELSRLIISEKPFVAVHSVVFDGEVDRVSSYTRSRACEVQFGTHIKAPFRLEEMAQMLEFRDNKDMDMSFDNTRINHVLEAPSSINPGQPDWVEGVRIPTYEEHSGAMFSDREISYTAGAITVRLSQKLTSVFTKTGWNCAVVEAERSDWPVPQGFWDGERESVLEPVVFFGHSRFPSDDVVIVPPSKADRKDDTFLKLAVAGGVISIAAIVITS